MVIVSMHKYISSLAVTAFLAAHLPRTAEAADWNQVTVVEVISIGETPSTGNFYIAANAPLCTNGNTTGHFDAAATEGGKSRTLSLLLALYLSRRSVRLYTNIIGSECRVQFMEAL